MCDPTGNTVELPVVANIVHRRLVSGIAGILREDTDAASDESGPPCPCLEMGGKACFAIYSHIPSHTIVRLYPHGF